MGASGALPVETRHWIPDRWQSEAAGTGMDIPALHIARAGSG